MVSASFRWLDLLGEFVGLECENAQQAVLPLPVKSAFGTLTRLAFTPGRNKEWVTLCIADYTERKV